MPDQAIVSRFELPSANLANASKKVARFARKAVKLGMTAPALTVVREFVRVWIDPSTYFDGGLPYCFRLDTETSALDMVEVEVTGERPVIAGWDFVATLEHLDGSNLLRKVPGCDIDLPHEYRTCGPEHCDHCGKRRRRNNTFVILHTETGEWQRVGRSCLQDFLGDASPAAWMSTFELLRSLGELSDWDADGCGGFGFASPVVVREVFLAGVAAECRLFGWTPASKAGFGTTCTADSVYNALASNNREDREAALRAITDEDRLVAADALAWIATDEAGSNDYIHNLRTVASLVTVSTRHNRLLASLVPAFRKDLGRRVEKAAKLNEHLDVAVKDKVEIDLTLVAAPSYETDYGPKWILRFEDSKGRTVVWKTGSPRGLHQDYEVGQAVTVRGTVKALSQYRDTKQTELTRCKIAPVPES